MMKKTRWFSFSVIFIALGALMSPIAWAASAWVTANHVSLRYRIDGSGSQVLVLLQESAVPLEVWDEILPSILTPQRKVLRYDLRGFGLSEKFRGAVTMQDEVDDLRALLAATGIRGPVTLVAGALGGSIALQYAAQFPQDVTAVFVTSPSAVLTAKEPRMRVDPAVDPQGYLQAQERTWNVTYPEEFRSNTRRWNRFRAMEAANDFESEVATEALINTTPFADVLPKIQCPVMLVATSLFVRPVESVKQLADAIPKGQFAVLRTGHLASYQSPELVAPLLNRFLKEQAQ